MMDVWGGSIWLEGSLSGGPDPDPDPDRDEVVSLVWATCRHVAGRRVTSRAMAW